MNITDLLLKLDDTLSPHNEGEWGNTVSQYSAFNDAGLECEVGEFMYAMCRILKPQNVFETGTHWGIGASYMGMALKDNGLGHLDTLEFLPEIHARAQERIAKLGLQDYVTCHLIDAAKFVPTGKYQLALLDTEPQTRYAEAVRYYDGLDFGAFVFIHDLHRHMHQIDNENCFAWPYGPLPQQLKDLVKNDQLRPFHFATPRGLTGFYKTHPDDYKWS